MASVWDTVCPFLVVNFWQLQMVVTGLHLVRLKKNAFMISRMELFFAL